MKKIPLGQKSLLLSCFDSCDQPTPPVFYIAKYLYILSAEEWGWTSNNEQGWVPLWMIIPGAATTNELIKCECQSK